VPLSRQHLASVTSCYVRSEPAAVPPPPSRLVARHARTCLSASDLLDRFCAAAAALTWGAFAPVSSPPLCFLHSFLTRSTESVVFASLCCTATYRKCLIEVEYLIAVAAFWWVAESSPHPISVPPPLPSRFLRVTVTHRRTDDFLVPYQPATVLGISTTLAAPS
jgi:hypothetical protein